MRKHDVEITLTASVFADSIEDAKATVEDTFVLPLAHLMDPHVVEIVVWKTDETSMY